MASSTAGGPDAGADATALAPDVLDSPRAGRVMLRGSALRSAGYVAGIVLGLVSAPLLVRHLGVVDFGWWVTITALIFIVNGLTELGMTAVGVREYSVREAAGRASLIRELLAIRMLTALAGAALAVVFAAAAGYDDRLVLGTAIASLSLVVNAVQTTYSTPLHATLRLGWITVLDLVRQVVTVALIVVLVLAGAGLVSFFAVPVLGGLTALTLTVPLVRGRIPMFPTARVRQAWPLIRATLPYAAATAFGIIYFRVEIVLMSLIASDQETGEFAVAFRVVEIAAGIPWLLVNSAFPILARAARDDEARLRYAVGRLFEGSLIAGGALALALGFGAAFTVRLLGGDDPSIAVLQTLSGALLLNFFVATWAFALLSLGRYRALLVNNAGAFLIGIGLTLALVPTYGAIGAAVAVTLTEGMLALLNGLALVRARKELSPPLRILRRVAVAGVVTIVPLLFLPLPSIAEAIVAPVLFVGILAVSRALPTELISAARGR